jgi:acyl-coenzyme A thioesterase PaaI-like protein
MEVEQTDEGLVRARGFVKQDHMGAVRGAAHEGILAAALSEAMAFAAGADMAVSSFEVELHGIVPVGAFIEVEAHVVGGAGGTLEARAAAWVEGKQVAASRGSYAGAPERSPG